MSKLLLNLRHVSDDEADDVRAMLDAHRIAFYETPPSLFGISAGGIFITENDDIAQAKRLTAKTGSGSLIVPSGLVGKCQGEGEQGVRVRFSAIMRPHKNGVQERGQVHLSD